MIDLAEDARAVKRRYLDDITGEFPRLDERFSGLSYASVDTQKRPLMVT